jgi:hypothetical protein
MTNHRIATLITTTDENPAPTVGVTLDCGCKGSMDQNYQQVTITPCAEHILTAPGPQQALLRVLAALAPITRPQNHRGELLTRSLAAEGFVGMGPEHPDKAGAFERAARTLYDAGYRAGGAGRMTELANATARANAAETVERTTRELLGTNYKYQAQTLAYLQWLRQRAIVHGTPTDRGDIERAIRFTEGRPTYDDRLYSSGSVPE